MNYYNASQSFPGENSTVHPSGPQRIEKAGLVPMGEGTGSGRQEHGHGKSAYLRAEREGHGLNNG